MTTFWDSLASTDNFNAYSQAAWNQFTINGQLPSDQWNCRFNSPDWTACFTTNAWWIPYIILTVNAFMGLAAQATTNFGWLATDDTMEVADSFTNGKHSVWVWWYQLDSFLNSYYKYFEALFTVTHMTVLGSLIIYFNKDDWQTNPYFWFGIVDLVIVLAYLTMISAVIAEEVIQTVRLQAAYKLDEPVYITFPTLFNQGGR